MMIIDDYPNIEIQQIYRKTRSGLIKRKCKVLTVACFENSGSRHIQLCLKQFQKNSPDFILRFLKTITLAKTILQCKCIGCATTTTTR